MLQVLGRIGTYTIDVVCALVVLYLAAGVGKYPGLWWAMLAVGGGRLVVEAELPPHMRETFTTLGFHAGRAQAPARR